MPEEVSSFFLDVSCRCLEDHSLGSASGNRISTRNRHVKGVSGYGTRSSAIPRSIKHTHREGSCTHLRVCRHPCCGWLCLQPRSCCDPDHRHFLPYRCLVYRLGVNDAKALDIHASSTRNWFDIPCNTWGTFPTTHNSLADRKRNCFRSGSAGYAVAVDGT